MNPRAQLPATPESCRRSSFTPYHFWILPKARMCSVSKVGRPRAKPSSALKRVEPGAGGEDRKSRQPPFKASFPIPGTVPSDTRLWRDLPQSHLLDFPEANHRSRLLMRCQNLRSTRQETGLPLSCDVSAISLSATCTAADMKQLPDRCFVSLKASEAETVRIGNQPFGDLRKSDVASSCACGNPRLPCRLRFLQAIYCGQRLRVLIETQAARGIGK